MYKIDQNLSKSIETRHDQVNESILPKGFEDTALHKHYGINQKKDVSKINVGSNKVYVVSLTNFFNFLKLC